MMEKIPEDLLLDFLSRIPTKYLLRATSVSKTWHSIVSEEYFRDLHCCRLPSERNSTPLFFTTHRIGNLAVISLTLAEDCPQDKTKPRIYHILKKQSFEELNSSTWNDDDYVLSNTCNGLLCIKPNDYKQPIEVCNPVTREYTTIPACSTEDMLLGYSVGLGFSLSTKEYKVVAIALDYNSGYFNWEYGSPGKLMVHTLGSGESWRHIEDVYFIPRKGPVYVDGKMYWIVTFDHSSHKFCLLSFDLESEKSMMIEHVPGLMGNLQLVEFEGRISVVFSMKACIEIYVLKDFKRSQWERRHRIVLPRAPIGMEETFSRLVGLWERGEVLQIWLRDVMILYDERKSSKERCTMYEGPELSHENRMTWHLCTNYKPSLVSLKRIGCESRKAYADLIRNMELPPNCHPKRIVIDLDL